MAIRVPDSGSLIFLGAAWGQLAVPSTAEIRLCTNSPETVFSTYGDAVVEGYFTEAVTDGVYQRITLPVPTVADVAGIATAAFAVQTFTFAEALTGNLTVYGYYIFDPPSGAILFYEEFASSVTPGAGDTIPLTINFQLSKGTPT